MHDQEIKKDKNFLFIYLYFSRCNRLLYIVIISFYISFFYLKSYKYFD